MNILTVNLAFSTVVFWIAARLYLFPRLATLSTLTIMPPILLLHALRHLGLMFLAAGAVHPGMPATFAYPGRLATFSLLCLRSRRCMPW
jgi:hypothetical protein